MLLVLNVKHEFPEHMSRVLFSLCDTYVLERGGMLISSAPL